MPESLQEVLKSMPIADLKAWQKELGEKDAITFKAFSKVEDMENKETPEYKECMEKLAETKLLRGFIQEEIDGRFEILLTLAKKENK